MSMTQYPSPTPPNEQARKASYPLPLERENWECMSETFTITAKLWIWTSDKAPACWHFITIDGEVAEAIRVADLMDRLERTGSTRRRGWGAIKVQVTIGETSWNTSIFPAKEAGGYMLPVKAGVRKSEGFVAGDDVTVSLAL